jgi:hypothetical protein
MSEHNLLIAERAVREAISRASNERGELPLVFRATRAVI